MYLRVYGVIGEETGGGWRMVDPVGRGYVCLLVRGWDTWVVFICTR